MPPKAKFTAEEIIDAALDIVRKYGFDALTARALGAGLGSSARPVFTVFGSMDEVQAEVTKAARDLYDSYVMKALDSSPANTPRFKCVGEQYIRFAVTEPKLFCLLFMRERTDMPEFANVLPVIEDNYEAILSSIETGYGLDRPSSLKLYKHLWVYTHGIASLCATKTCSFTGDEISEMLNEVFLSLLKNPEVIVKNDQDQ